MTWLWVMLGVILVFFVIPRFFRALGRRGSSSSWDKVIASPDADQMFGPLVGGENFTYGAAKLLRPFGIDYMKFCSNVLYLMHEGQMEHAALMGDAQAIRQFRYYTPSISEFAARFTRPLGMPTWMVAAFPDVLSWINESTPEEDRMEVLLSGIDESELERAFGGESEVTNATIDVYRRMIENYLREVRPRLEAQ